MSEQSAKQDKQIQRLNEMFFEQEMAISKLNDLVNRNSQKSNFTGYNESTNDAWNYKANTDLILFNTGRNEKIPGIKEAWTKLLLGASIHGIPRIIKTDLNLVKFIWAVSILISGSFGIYTIINTLKDFLSYDVISLTERIEETAITIPAITLCALKVFQVDFLSTINKCNFGDISCRLPQDFEYFVMSDSENELDCWKINGYTNYSTIKNSYGSGAINGVRLEFNMANNFFAYIADNTLNSYNKLNPSLIVPDNSYDIQMIKSVDNKLEEPYNSCDAVEDKSYRKDNCIEKCLHDNVLVKFGCSIRNYYADPLLNHCDLERTPAYKADVSENCEVSCPKECDQTVYDLSITRQIIPSNEGSNSTTNTYLAVFFQGSTHIELTQIPKITSATLLSGIGGSLSLFIGVRFLSLVEIIEFLIDSGYSKFMEKYAKDQYSFS